MKSSTAPPVTTRRVPWMVLASVAILGAAIAAAVVLRVAVRSLPMVMAGGWSSWFGTFNGVVLLTVAMLPIAALLVVVLARRRRAAGVLGAWRWSLAEVAMIYGTLPWVWMIMLPGAGAGVVPGRLSLVPLRDLLTILGSGPMTATVQVGGNLLVFAALGFFAPIRFAWLNSVPRVLALGAVCSIVVEVAQFVLRLDRVSSVDDVLLNSAGAGLAALASRRWWRANPNSV